MLYSIKDSLLDDDIFDIAGKPIKEDDEELAFHENLKVMKQILLK